MPTQRAFWFFCPPLVALLATLTIQDPERRATTSRPEASRPKPERPLLPPVEEPFRSKVERRDLLQRFDEPSPLEGFYALRSMRQPDGAIVRATAGYAWFGRKHMMLHLSLTPDPKRPAFVQSSVRTYRIEGDVLTTTTLSGHESSGRLAVEQPGRVEVRRFRQAGTVLRIYRGENSWMEFVRQE